jgi:hypothetical protein
MAEIFDPELSIRAFFADDEATLAYFEKNKENYIGKILDEANATLDYYIEEIMVEAQKKKKTKGKKKKGEKKD